MAWGVSAPGWSDQNTVKLQTAAKEGYGIIILIFIDERDSFRSGFRERRDPVEGRASGLGAPMVVIDKAARLGRHAAPGHGWTI
jgi:hypothetical protein